MALLLKANNKFSYVSPVNGREFSLEELQGYVGGYIELVRVRPLSSPELPSPDGKRWLLPDGAVMYVNEEGRIKHPPLPLNVLATYLYVDVFALQENVAILGDVIVCSREEGGVHD